MYVVFFSINPRRTERVYNSLTNKKNINNKNK